MADPVVIAKAPPANYATFPRPKQEELAVLYYTANDAGVQVVLAAPIGGLVRDGWLITSPNPAVLKHQKNSFKIETSVVFLKLSCFLVIFMRH